MISERVPILARLVLSKERELNVRSESLKKSTIQVVDSSTKLQSSRTSQQADHSKTAWYTSATPAVFFYTIAASFAAILAGCTLSFPSSAVYVVRTRLSHAGRVTKNKTDGFEKKDFLLRYLPLIFY